MKKDIIPLKGNVMMNFTLYGVRARVALQLKDGYDHHLNWLAWYYWWHDTIGLTKLAVSFYERDLTDCLFLITWYLVQRSLECSVSIVFSTDRLLLFRSSYSAEIFRFICKVFPTAIQHQNYRVVPPQNMSVRIWKILNDPEWPWALTHNRSCCLSSIQRETRDDW